MNLNQPQISFLRESFARDAAANRKATPSMFVAGLYDTELHYGYIVSVAPKMQVRGCGNVQWLEPVENVPYEEATLFRDAKNKANQSLWSNVKYTEFHLVAGYERDNVCVLVCLRQLVGSMFKPHLGPLHELVDASPAPIQPTPPQFGCPKRVAGESEGAPVKRARGESGTDLLLRAAQDTSSYPAALKQRDEYKKTTNSLLANLGRTCRELCTTLEPHKPTAALYLDADHAVTTKALSARGFHTEDMYCPNESQSTLDAMERELRASSVRGLPHFKMMTMEAFTARRHDREFSYVWIDGVCTWEGSGAHCTRDAVLNLFRNQLLAPFALVAYTCSIRPKSGPRTVRAKQDVLANFREIRAAASKAGYSVCLKPEYSQNSGSQNADHMYTSWFRVFK
jgi:hypothetical protein